MRRPAGALLLISLNEESSIFGVNEGFAFVQIGGGGTGDYMHTAFKIYSTHITQEI